MAMAEAQATNGNYGTHDHHTKS